MKTEDPLFDLIKSLSQNEKRHFSIYAKRHVIGEQNNYTSLFKEIDKQKIYNESKLIKKFLGTKMASNISVTKHQLYQLILDSLTAYHKGKTVDSELYNLMEKISILFNKGLIKQCQKLVIKARKLAEDYERYTILIEIVFWERRLHSKAYYKEIEKVKELHKEEKDYLNKIDNIGAFFNLYVTSFTQLILKGRTRNEERAKEFQQLLKDPLLSHQDKALTYTSKVFYHSIHANYNDSIGNDRENNNHQKQLITLLETNPKILKTDFSRYITFIDNYCISGIRLGEYEKCLEQLQKLRNRYDDLKITKTPSLNARVFTTISMHKLCIYYRQGEFEKGLAIIPSIEEDLENYSKYILKQRKHDLMYDLFYTYFGNGNFKKALNWLNACINDSDITLRPAEISSLKILEIIVHYELGNEELVSFLVRNNYRFLLNKGQLFSSENLFLKFVRIRLPQINTNKELQNHFANLKQELLEIQKDPYEQQFLDPFDIIGWLDSKISGIRFTAIKQY